MKNGTLEFDTSVQVGKALDGYKYFKKTDWKSFETSQGRTVVEFTGSVNLDAYKGAQYGNLAVGDGLQISAKMVEQAKSFVPNLEIEYTVQFLISKADNSFKVGHSVIKIHGSFPGNAKNISPEMPDAKLDCLKSVYANQPDPATVGMLFTFSAQARDKEAEYAAEEERKAKAAEETRRAEAAQRVADEQRAREAEVVRKLKAEKLDAHNEKRNAEVAKLKAEATDLGNRLVKCEQNEKKELDEVEKSLASKLSSLKGEVEALRTKADELQKTLDNAKQKHDPLKTQTADMTSTRVAIEGRYNPLIEKAKGTAASTKADADKFRADSLAIAAKFINDTIDYRRLAIEKVPANGTFPDKTESGSSPAEFAGEVFENKEEIVDIGRNISLAKAGDLLPNREGFVSVLARLSQESAGGGMDVQSKMYLMTKLHVKVFSHFPPKLDDARARQGFVQMYWRYAKNLPLHQAAAQRIAAQQAALENEARKTLDSWDSQNSTKLKSLQEQVSTLATLTAESASKLALCKAEVAAKELVLNKPQAEQAAALRQEVSARYAEIKRPLKDQLTQLATRLKETNTQPPAMAPEVRPYEKPIDTKTDHSGFKLGSFRKDLEAVVAGETKGTAWVFDEVRERGEEPLENATSLHVEVLPDGAKFGNMPIEKFFFVYLDQRLVRIEMKIDFHKPSPEEAKQSWQVLVIALTEKYGTPTSVEKDGSGYITNATWRGSDIVLRCAHRQGIILSSKKAYREATACLQQREQEKGKDAAKKARDLKSNL
ncbi:MAG: hypothetical protein WC740_17595 [Verrucomicrobiia bacterium]